MCHTLNFEDESEKSRNELKEASSLPKAVDLLHKSEFRGRQTSCKKAHWTEIGQKPEVLRQKL